MNSFWEFCTDAVREGKKVIARQPEGCPEFAAMWLEFDRDTKQLVCKISEWFENGDYIREKYPVVIREYSDFYDCLFDAVSIMREYCIGDRENESEDAPFTEAEYYRLYDLKEEIARS